MYVARTLFAVVVFSHFDVLIMLLQPCAELLVSRISMKVLLNHFYCRFIVILLLFSL